MATPFTKEQIKKAKDIDLKSYVESRGYTVENSDSKAWHVKEMGGLYLFKNSNRFHQ